MRPPGNERRPQAAFLKAAESFGGDKDIVSPEADVVVDGAPARVVFNGGPKIAGVVQIDARPRRGDNELRDGDRVLRALQSVECLPAGASVILTVAAGQYVHPAVEHVRHHGKHIGQITVSCNDATTVARWMRGLRDGVEAIGGW